jgi:hypothetical protein
MTIREMCLLSGCVGWIGAWVCAWVFGWWQHDVRHLSFEELRDLLLAIKAEYVTRGGRLKSSTNDGEA